MKWIPLFAALLFASCAHNTPPITDAPRAIPVKPVIKKLDKRITVLDHKAEDLQKQAERALERGIAPGSDQGKQLVDSTKSIRKELVEAKTEITQINERADALVTERDHFFKQASSLSKENVDLGKKVAVADTRRWFWIKYSIAATALILFYILLKILRLYGLSINPLSYIR